MTDPNGSALRSPAAGGASESARLGRCLVTGAAGFVGRNLVRALLERGCRVRALIHRTPLEMAHERLQRVQGDVRNLGDMLRACEGVDTVFHTAATICLLGGRGATPDYRRGAYQTNVEGTRNILTGCRRQGVERLVHTSSFDVCFHGSPMLEMGEAAPYADRVKSLYAETKIAAEKLVLEANGCEGLLTCAIRPDGIYGAEPNYMLDRFMVELTGGKLLAVVGDGSALQDTSHIENVVHGELLAAQQLVPGGAACGKAYFITDEEPKNAFEFFRPLIEGLGYRFPRFRLPSGLLMPVMRLWQYLHFRLGVAAPLLTPHELAKVSVSHSASTDAAREDLGYRPIKTVEEAMGECLAYCKSVLPGGDRDDAGAMP
jgi:3beta-hydroxy-delta5-steroid dehydrogenase/steroid delta-isomerase